MLWLMRHPPVVPEWQHRCYGWTDVPLAPFDSADLVRALPKSITRVWHSGLQRTRLIAELLNGPRIIEDRRLRERNFGTWEGRTWNELYAETGEAMLKMLSEPDTWAPPEGETTFQLRDRVWAWYQELSLGEDQLVLTHGGPIAVLLGTLRGLPVAEWPSLIPKPGTLRQLELSARLGTSAT